MRKPAVMLLLGLGLLGAYLFIARRASAESLVANGAGGATGATGGLGFNDAVPSQFKPIPFEGTGPSPFSGPGATPKKPLAPARAPVQPSQPARPRPAIPQNPLPRRAGAVPRAAPIPKGGVRRAFD